MTQCVSEDCRLSPAAFTGRREETSRLTDFLSAELQLLLSFGFIKRSLLSNYLFLYSLNKIDFLKQNPSATLSHPGLASLFASKTLMCAPCLRKFRCLDKFYC